MAEIILNSSNFESEVLASDKPVVVEEKRHVKKKSKNKDREYRVDETLSRDRIDVHDEHQRTRYVNSCLEQIKEASKELEKLSEEYNIVTSYLTDMELIAFSFSH
mgnify:CR=1 FL=1